MRNSVIALTLAISTTQALANEPGPRFRAPELVAAIVYDEFAQIHSRDPLTQAIRDRYIDGFAALLDRACRFLPAASYDAVRGRLDAVEADPQAGVVASAAAAGIADGRAFADRFDCSHSKAQRAQRHLAAVFGVAVTQPVRARHAPVN
jgi:hypothetical protein